MVETLLGLLHLTWETLDRTHQLSQKLSIEGETLLANAARQLGVTTPIGDLLARRVGGGRPAAPGRGGQPRDARRSPR